MTANRTASDFAVLFLRGRKASFGLFGQKAAGLHEPVFWDYHVILLDVPEESVFDFDFLGRFPCPVSEYVRLAFFLTSAWPQEVQALVRDLPLDEYLARFSSDRSHMLDQQGKPRSPFPPWPAISADSRPLTLGNLLDPAHADPVISPFRPWQEFFSTY